MLTAFGSDYRHSTPPREGMKYGFRERDIVAWRFTKRQSGYQGDYWGLSLSGNCCPAHYTLAFGYYAASVPLPTRWHFRVLVSGKVVEEFPSSRAYDVSRSP